jgi:sialic acid synthase SpsE/RimJ/RimL family protein N-acetyltransferase
MRELRLGRRILGAAHPVYFIAEAGSNHDRDLGQAHRLIDVAAEAGADAVKFQTFRAAKLYPRSAGMTDYLAVPRSIYDIIQDLEMPLEWVPELAEHAARLGLDFLSTPFDEMSADAIAPHVPAFKIASYEMTHHALVQHCARKGKPLIVSTGTATLDEVREMVEAVRAVGCEDLVVLQCTAKYPSPLGALNLRAMRTIGDELGVLVGFSDHSREPLPGPMAATALGACLIEKHFTLDNDLPGPDHAYALEPDELAAAIRGVRGVEKSLGTSLKQPAPEEQELRAFARRTIFTTRAVAAGDRLTVDNTAVLRSGKLPYGLHPREIVRVLGRTARRPLATEATLRADDLDPLLLGDGDVKLRPHAAEDAERIVAWRNRPDVHGQMFAAHPPTRAEHDAWFAKLERRTDRLELVILDQGRPVGTIALAAIDLGARTAEYGILIGESEARGRGVAQAASQLLLDFAFGVLGLERVSLGLFADNLAARKLYERLGFTVDDAAQPRQKDREVLRMTLTRKDLA